MLMEFARFHGRKVPTSVVRDNIVNIDSHMQCLLCIWHRRPLSLHLGCVVDWVNLCWEGGTDTDCQGGQNLAAFSNMFFVSPVTWRLRQIYSDSKSTPEKAPESVKREATEATGPVVRHIGLCNVKDPDLTRMFLSINENVLISNPF